MSIATRIEAIEQHITDDYSVLELAGADLTNVDKNIINLKETWKERLLYFMANGTDVVWNNWLPKVTGIGETITLNNTIEAKMDFVYKANTSQKTTTGKNLFNSIYYKNKEIYTETISISTGNLYCTKLYLKPNTTYTISEALNNWSLDGGWIFVVADTNNQIIRFLQNRQQDYQTTPTTFTTNSEGYVYIGHRYGFTNGGADRAIAFLNTVNIQIEEGNTATSFEEYTGGPSPNPDYPQDIQVVSGDNTIKVEGKNLFDKSKISSVSGGTNNNGIITTTDGSCSVFLSSGGYIPVNNGETIYFSADIKLNSSSSGVWNNINDGVNGGTTKILHPTLSTTYQRYQTSFTYSSNRSIDRIFIQNFNLSGSIEISNIMISKNNNATYEPYQTPQTYPINIGNIELCKIGNYQDRIYKDNGKWYLNKQIGKVVLDGSEAWAKGSQTNVSVFVLSNVIYPQVYGENGVGLSNRFKYEYVNNANAFYFGWSNNVVIVMPNTYTLESFKTWLSSNNTSVYYITTPTTTEITDTTLIYQLEAIKKSYNTQTNINQTNTDKPFILDVTALGN